LSQGGAARTQGRFGRDWFLLILVLGILVCAPLDSGATGPWSQALMETGCLLLPVLFLTRLNSPFVRPPGWLPLLLLLGYCLLQLVPLPPIILSKLSPATWSHYQEGIWLIQPGSWLPLSLHPKATVMTFWRLASYAAVFLILIQLLNSHSRLRFFVKTLVGFGGLYALLGMAQFLVPTKRALWIFSEWPERTSHHFATYVNGNHYAGLIGMLLPLALALMLYYLPRRLYSNWRESVVEFFSNPDTLNFGWVLLAAVLMGTSIFFSLSRGGVLATLGALAGFFLLQVFLGGQSKKIMFPCLVLVLILGAVGWIGWDPIFERFASVRSASGELNTQRLDYWQDSLINLRNYPLLGTGFGTFADVYPQVQTVTTRRLVDHAHNDYVELAVEGGAVGTLLAAWFLLEVLLRSYLASRQRRHPLSFHLWLGAAAGVISLLLHGMTDFNLQIPANALCFFVLLALVVAAAHTRSRQTDSLSTLPPLKSRPVRRLLVTFSLILLAGGLGYGLASATAVSWLDSLGPIETSSREEDQVQEQKVALLSRAAKLDPLSGRLSFALGQLNWARAGERHGLDYYARALEQLPVSGFYANGLAKALAAEGMNQHVEKLLRAATEYDRAEPEYWKDLGFLLVSHGDIEQGLMAFRQVMQLRPLQTRSFMTFMILQGLDDVELERAIPEVPQAQLQIAGYFQDRGVAGRAEAHLEHAMELAERPSWRQPEVFEQAADYYFKIGRIPEAFLVLQRATAAFPDSVELLLRLAGLSEREKLSSQAIESYRKVILLDPLNMQARMHLQKLEPTPHRQ
jgi:O-antigen ligase/tetratricopeptide (TPR) repeat protein